MKLDHTEFDKFAEEYHSIHKKNIKFSGEDPDYFFEYKIKDLCGIVDNHELGNPYQILDFGCGIGNSINYLHKYFPASKIHGIDISEKSIEIAQKRFGDFAELKSYDGEKLPYEDEQFDVIFVACVFHHIPQDLYQNIYAEIRRVLKKGGVFVIFEHNPLNFLTVRAVNTCPFDENAILITSSDLRATLERYYFTRTYTHYRIFFPSFLSKLRFIEPALRWLPLGAQYYVVAQ